MRLYRLCEHEGRLDLGAYSALKSDITIHEALELETALCVIGDHRAEWAEYYQEVKGKKPEDAQTSGALVQPSALPGPTVAQLRDELAHREQCLARDEGLLGAHRRAVALAASGQPEPPGRLDLGAVAHLERSTSSHRQIVTYLTGQIANGHENHD